MEVWASHFSLQFAGLQSAFVAPTLPKNEPQSDHNCALVHDKFIVHETFTPEILLYHPLWAVSMLHVFQLKGTETTLSLP